ncbi:AsnC family protein [Agrococcus sp. Marseille-Q4369]|uniref:AsnC family protein n=1 Tax=Agrococcus sp. Marseille-Q4369 TaxID=2810513 RepID=UPI001B8ACAD9|nr:AsnC family protein [Agrococcus sp. Marseille-Q4369]QUW18505.1 AsnC family protein [Agrococcus sp. Marseille-Q4369]
MDDATATGEQPRGVLEELAALAATRRDLEREESALARRARMEGFPWQAIADALGVSRQAVHKKHGKR